MLAISRPRFLCVDDDEDSRVMLTTLLNLALIEATPARSTERLFGQAVKVKGRWYAVVQFAN